MTWRHGWKFRLLLVALLALLGVEPLLGDGSIPRLCYTTLWSVVLIATIYAISDIRWQRYLGLGLGVPLVAGIWLRHLLSAPSEAAFELFVFGLAAIFLATVAVLVMRHLVISEVTTDNVAGAVCAYLFLGLAMGVLYSILETLHPHSFQAADHLAADLLDPIQRRALLVYYSLITLTTVGYGDILPATPLTRILAALEAILGQFYLAILVAGLVGIRVSRHTK